MSVSIAIDHVVKKFGDNVIIPDLTANIKNGELFTLLGPSGCGKTTLLRMIAGFNSIEGGTIAFGDQVINDLPAYKRNIGMVFQSYAIFPHLTVRRNVEYGLRLRNVPKDEMKKRTDEMLSLVHIDEYQDRLPERLSGGQQARVALARTLYHKRPLLILDDPFSAVDRKTEEEILTNIRPMLKDSIVILISHRLHFFKDFDRVVWISGDGSVEVLPHEELLSRNREYRRLWKMQHALAEGGDDK